MVELYADKGLSLHGFGYNIPNMMGLFKMGYSNISYATPYRSFVETQVAVPSESLMDMMAEKIGMDPFEFRYKNIARPGDLTVNNRPWREYAGGRAHGHAAAEVRGRRGRGEEGEHARARNAA